MQCIEYEDLLPKPFFQKFIQDPVKGLYTLDIFTQYCDIKIKIHFYKKDIFSSKYCNDISKYLELSTNKYFQYIWKKKVLLDSKIRPKKIPSNFHNLQYNC